MAGPGAPAPARVGTPGGGFGPLAEATRLRVEAALPRLCDLPRPLAGPGLERARQADQRSADPPSPRPGPSSASAISAGVARPSSTMAWAVASRVEWVSGLTAPSASTRWTIATRPRHAGGRQVAVQLEADLGVAAAAVGAPRGTRPSARRRPRSAARRTSREVRVLHRQHAAGPDAAPHLAKQRDRVLQVLQEGAGEHQVVGSRARPRPSRRRRAARRSRVPALARRLAGQADLDRVHVDADDVPIGPTRSAIANDTSPPPQPRSRQRSPDRRPIRSNRLLGSRAERPGQQLEAVVPLPASSDDVAGHGRESRRPRRRLSPRRSWDWHSRAPAAYARVSRGGECHRPSSWSTTIAPCAS